MTIQECSNFTFVKSLNFTTGYGPPPPILSARVLSHYYCIVEIPTQPNPSEGFLNPVQFEVSSFVWQMKKLFHKNMQVNQFFVSKWLCESFHAYMPNFGRVSINWIALVICNQKQKKDVSILDLIVSKIKTIWSACIAVFNTISCFP